LELTKSLHLKLNKEINKAKNYDVVMMDLVSGFESRLRHRVDVLIFNPPYVPSGDDLVEDDLISEDKHGISAAWAGGQDGRQVLDRLLPKISVRHINTSIDVQSSQGFVD